MWSTVVYELIWKNVKRFFPLVKFETKFNLKKKKATWINADGHQSDGMFEIAQNHAGLDDKTVMERIRE